MDFKNRQDRSHALISTPSEEVSIGEDLNLFLLHQRSVFVMRSLPSPLAQVIFELRAITLHVVEQQH